MCGFCHQIFPGISHLSSSAQTLASGFLAVISVNIVIGFYIYSAMKEAPRQEPQPDAPSQRMLKQVLTSQHLLK
uniref:Vacuolar ATPase assembly integral membrane protein VMA21 homolog n=1 Tax=Triticum urartu TaxID=4572 RepID=A0A8R7U7V5_TRIUA